MSRKVKTHITITAFRILLGILCLAPCGVFAQYDDLRTVQEHDEIARFRNLKIKAEYKFPAQGKQKKIAEEERQFDTLGRIVRIATAKRKQDITYDDAGRVAMIIDSSLNARGTEFTRFDYEYEYGAFGKLSFARIPPYNLSFSYEPKEKHLSEITQIDNNEYRKRNFYYDKGDRLIKEEWFYSFGKLEKRRTISYTKRGKPDKEVIYKCFENYSSDSEFVFYHYDANNRLTEQKIVSAGYFPPGSEEGGGKLKDIDTTIYRYSYNTSGIKTSEQFYYSVPGYNHRYEWIYSPEGFKQEERYYDDKNILQAKYIFKYSLYNDKAGKIKKR